jgi:hypothetical protein
MTRINANIPPKLLTDQHLLAEHREIKRICDLYNKRIAKGCINDIPKTFALGSGHVLFFLDKGKFTHNRYLALHEECKKRKFDVSFYGDNWDCYKMPVNNFYNDWEATEQDNELIIWRIIFRLRNSPQIPRFYGKTVSVKSTVSTLISKF